MSVLPGLKRVREEFDARGAEVFACLEFSSFGITEIAPTNVDTVPFISQE